MSYEVEVEVMQSSPLLLDPPMQQQEQPHKCAFSAICVECGGMERPRKPMSVPRKEGMRPLIGQMS